MTQYFFVGSEFLPADGILSFGGQLAWLKPVRPGDELPIEAEVIETRVSPSRNGSGIVQMQITTLNQDGDVVQTFTPTLLVQRSPI
jgi:acyl dehydratase